MCPSCGGKLEWFRDGGEVVNYEENWYRCEVCGDEWENSELGQIEREAQFEDKHELCDGVKCEKEYPHCVCSDKSKGNLVNERLGIFR